MEKRSGFISPAKRPLQDSDTISQRPNKALKSSSVRSWLEQVEGPDQEVMPRGKPKATASAIDPDACESTYPHSAYAPNDQSSNTQSISSVKSKTADPLYRTVLRANGVEIDDAGRKIPECLRQFLDSEILRERPEIALRAEDIKRVIDISLYTASSNETTVNGPLYSPIFPYDLADRGLSREGENLWYTDGVPNNPDFHISLSVPKPDHFIGYSETSWTKPQVGVINHLTVIPFTRPGKANAFPFLIIEMKSESGGHLPVAVNQAAGSGSACVNSIRWLLGEAQKVKGAKDVSAPDCNGPATTNGVENSTVTNASKPIEPHVNDEKKDENGNDGKDDEDRYDGNDLDVEDNNDDQNTNDLTKTEVELIKKTLAFSLAMNQNQAQFYVHWYSRETLYTSYVKGFWLREAPDIPKLHWTITNIIDWAVGERRKMITKALRQLSPVPATWKQVRKFLLIDDLEDESDRNKRVKTSNAVEPDEQRSACKEEHNAAAAAVESSTTHEAG